MPSPSLTRHDVEGSPRGLVLMLHGGRADELDPVDESSTSWRRSHWMMTHLRGRLGRAGVSVWLLRYQVRGWNARVAWPPSPVADARWALEQAHAELPETPVVILGHSMGGRTAVHVADDPAVVGVVGLAPWLSTDDPHRTLSGTRFLAAHGRSDKITSAKATRAYCARAGEVAVTADFVDMGRVGHYMFRHVPAWNRVAVEGSLAMLAESGGDPADEGRRSQGSADHV